ncbi:conserved hypothetical protein [Vibrio owensii]|uniref:hypothetical protein n=1 Tax=Vibrio owensii TaxID=696485 RepID=UPI002893B1C8|nr:conserved hypothetical protein [Vibrio owensii]CAH1565486.1 conserved hypothetical protein [Vibrio owensii]
MMSTKDARLRIANTILAQLGGNRFIVMTGAKQFVAIEQGLMFTLPACLAKLGINKVRVELAASDTYTMTALKVNARQGDAIEVLQESGVYCDQLEQTFEDLTGVYTRF